MTKRTILKEQGPVRLKTYPNNGNPIYYVNILPYHLGSKRFDNYNNAKIYFDKIINNEISFE